MREMNKVKARLLISFIITVTCLSILLIIREAKSAIQQKGLQDDVDHHLVDTSEEHNDNKEDLSTDVEEDIDTTEVILDDEINDVTMIFGGDVLLSDYHLSLYDQNNSSITSIVGTPLLEYMRSGDIFMVNQEFPFSNRGEKHKDKQYTFRIDPSRVNMMNELGIDIVTLANNHVLDYGEDALLDSIDILNREQIRLVGAGSDINSAKKPVVYDIGGKKIAYLAASRVIPVPEWNATTHKAGLLTTYDPSILLEEIKQAKSSNDYVVVYVHWGIEREEYPEDYQRNLGKQYIDAGADLVIGSHPHVLQGIEYYNGKPIVYSLGNYIFNSRTYSTMLIEAKVDKDNELTLSIIPCHSENGRITYEKEELWIEFYKKIEKRSFQATISEDGIVSEKTP